ncbi:tRNA-2-methylthio-N6-dimethylallyladenosine synthase [Desulfoprunum benzoelyticum]|uniref:tRNA-2-methylthio-N(6)-dimethylallyladenosine synthase n=2 Tax=Desulfoprunum benzoelyticum TaxID=1506996 RepID=A0A840UNV5_9BACT|nr:tRNA-2-methylthio-N6-dimethylallyladenosine synthase [Desulfoprunum benzoelyticum]
MSQILSTHGYAESHDMESADLVILNTCTIRAKAEQKVMSMLGALRKIKVQRPGMKICVAGCVAQQEGDHLLQRMPHVDLVLGTQNIYDLGTYIDRVAGTDRPVVATTMSKAFRIPAFLPADRKNSEPADELYSFKRFVTIMQGCDNYCSYCVVPYTRGREISRRAQDVVEEVRKLVAQGVREVTLLGQNVNSYGRKLNGTALPCTFPELLHQVAEIRGLQRLRFTTSHPKDLSDELIGCFRDIAILCPQFHLPVQSGSDAVLKRMNRHYTIANYLERVEALFSCRPDLALTTDIIVGFPGETDDDFALTMDLLERVRFHGSFSFKYSDRPGVRSCDFDGKISEEVKSERLAIFQRRQDEISLARNSAYVGSLLEIMIERTSENAFQGRTGTNHIVHVDEKTDLAPGDLLEVEIVHAGQHSLKGKVDSMH